MNTTTLIITKTLAFLTSDSGKQIIYTVSGFFAVVIIMPFLLFAVENANNSVIIPGCEVSESNNCLIQALSPPVTDMHITAEFGKYDPDEDGVETDHNGTDFGGEMGDSIFASHSGTVIDVESECPVIGEYGSSCGGGYGNYIIIEDKKGYITLYGHLSKVFVSVDDEVYRQQTIGEMGSSGSSTGFHVHFGVAPTTDQKWIDPYPLIIQSDYSGGSEMTAESKKELLSSSGMSEKEIAENFFFIDYIFSRESSWNYLAVNSESGAYGLCQALPGEKMNSVAADWKNNPKTQIIWCDNYAKQRYGDWESAYNFWIRNNWW